MHVVKLCTTWIRTSAARRFRNNAWTQNTRDSVIAIVIAKLYRHENFHEMNQHVREPGVVEQTHTESAAKMAVNVQAGFDYTGQRKQLSSESQGISSGSQGKDFGLA